MLYSPLLSFVRLILLIFWASISSTSQFFFHFVLRKDFFFFYKIFFKGLTYIFGIKLNIEGTPQKQNALFVCNHISYLDILILGSNLNGIFVAKSEISKWPIINKLCKLGRTIFVDRNNFIKVKDQVKLISDRLDKGLSVILFPEGTSSDGSKVLPFKSSLMGIIESKKEKNYKVQPVSISYSKLDGMPVELKFRPFFAWFGNMNLVSHAWKFLGLGLSEVKVHYHKPRRFSDFSGRKEAANYCHEILSLQISKDHQNMSVEEKIKLNEFKLL